MRQPPPVSAFHRHPIVAGTALLAVGVTLAWWSGPVDVSPLFVGPEIRRGEVWRLVTSALPHVNLMHLAFNVYWLWVFGTLLEETFGHARTFGTIVLLALGSSAAEYALMEGGVGLSGVGYGLFGMLWVLSRRDPRFTGAVDANTAVVFVAWFVLCIVTTVTGVMPVANVAHGVGALLGALLALAVIAPRRGLRALCVSAVVVLVVTFVAGGVAGRHYVNLTKDRGHEWAQLGYEALGANRDGDAVRHLRRAVEIDDRLAWAWFNLGVAYARQSLRDEAARAFERAAELEPADANYRAAVEGTRGNDTQPSDEAE